MSIRLKYRITNPQERTFYFSNNPDFEANIDDTYTLKLIDKQSNGEYVFSIEDKSIYPEKYNIFDLYTITGTTEDRIIMERGWYEYEITDNGKFIESGRCYLYLNDEAENDPQETATYTNTKTKYVYNR